MTLLTWVFLALFAFAELSTLILPYSLIKEAISGAKLRGVSLLTEIIFLIFAIMCSFFSSGSRWVNRPELVAFVGITTMFIVYIHLYFVLRISNNFVVRRRRQSGLQDNMEDILGEKR
ncbi:hypothetical protein BH09SUM1_BH09SUM1_25370 [soil metagenome]